MPKKNTHRNVHQQHHQHQHQHQHQHRKYMFTTPNPRQLPLMIYYKRYQNLPTIFNESNLDTVVNMVL